MWEGLVKGIFLRDNQKTKGWKIKTNKQQNWKEGRKKKEKKERKSLVKIRICNDNGNHQFKQQEIDLNRENGVEIREK